MMNMDICCKNIIKWASFVAKNRDICHKSLVKVMLVQQQRMEVYNIVYVNYGYNCSDMCTGEICIIYL